MANRDDLIRDLYKSVVGQEVYQTTVDDTRYHADTNTLHNADLLEPEGRSRRFEFSLESNEFIPISVGSKNFFLTKDQQFLMGDVLAFRELNNLKLTGSASLRTISGIERGIPGLMEGYCILYWNK